jgi:hypothetical protein
MAGIATVILGTGGTPLTDSIVQIVRRDLSANILTIQDGGPLATSWVLVTPPSGVNAIAGTWQWTGTDWTLLNFWYVKP